MVRYTAIIFCSRESPVISSGNRGVRGRVRKQQASADSIRPL